MLPQEESLNVLTKFLLQHGYRKVKGIPIDAIRKLARLVITDNVFIYEKKYYRQVVGGAMGSAFTLTLANIFMWKWEQRFVHRQLVSDGIYGRYIDDIFFTSNESLDTMNQMLDEVNQFHPNIKLVRQLGTSASFLDLHIENKNGTLATSVFHKEAAEPYILPFTSNHPRQVFKNIIDGALTRAIRYSSTLSAFNAERRSIQLILLYNSYPPRYIQTQFNKFFSSRFSTSYMLPNVGNQHTFALIRSNLLERPTILEHQMASRLAKAIKDDSKQEIDDPLVKARLNKQSKFDKNLINHQTYEKRLQNSKRDIHQLWNQTFTQTPVLNTRLIVGNRNNLNMTRELAHRQPRLTIQTNNNQPQHNHIYTDDETENE